VGGKVTDQSGRAVSGAVVTLKSNGLKATTDAAGAYSLTAEISSVNNMTILSGADALSMRNGIVTLRFAKPDQVRVELFDIRGNLLDRVIEKSATAGDFRFDAMKHRFASNMIVIRISIGQRTTSFRFLPFANSIGAVTSSAISSTPGKMSAKIQSIVDTLQVFAAGYTAKEVSITSYEVTVDITLETTNCTATPSKIASTTVSGSGPHEVVIETNSDPGINKGTIFRPKDLEPGKNYPIFVWGEGGCTQNGLSNKAAMGEIASWGYFIVADGTPGGGGMGKSSSSDMGDPKPFYDYITWAITQNGNPCSAYYLSLDTTKIAADGFSCGGLMAIKASGDPRFTAIGYTSSGLFAKDEALYKKIHTPIKIMNGGPKSAGNDMAYENGLRDYNDISPLGIPVVYFVKTSAGHGGDLDNGKGDFNTVNLAWLNWQLKGDEGATGKALLVGSDCKYCKASGWEFKSANWK
jgi:hypothetical protein